MNNPKSNQPTWHNIKAKNKEEQSMADEMEKTLERVESNSSVQELLFFDKNGLILRSTVDAARGQTYRNAFRSFSYVARKTVKNMDPRDDLKYIRMRTKGTEIILAPEQNGTLAVVQSVSPYDPPYRPPKKETMVVAPLKTKLGIAKKKEEDDTDLFS